MPIRRKWILFAIGVLLLMCAAPLWVMYVANGIAYGSLVGLPGRESDLKTFRFRAEVFLMLAMVVQFIGISLLARRWSARFAAISDNIVMREGFPLAIGLLSVAFVFIAIRGL